MGLNPQYVLDEMKIYEINALMKFQHYAFKDGWEQARFIAYVTAQVNSTQTLSPSDILPFSWEQEDENTDPELTDTEKMMLKKFASNYNKTSKIEKR